MSRKLSQKDLTELINSRATRISSAKESHLLFNAIYFSHYLTYDLASFHYKLIDLVDHPEYKMITATTFRGAGKSFLLTTSSPLYAIFGKPQKKFILIISQTAQLARHHMANIRRELEDNELLKNDLGPFKEVENTWNSQAIELAQHDALIKAISIDQGIRGIRHKQYRPDLIICDDIEDSQSVKTEESRQKTQDIFSSEIVPLGDEKTQIFLVGNHLHPNSLLSKYAQKIRTHKIHGKNIFVPLIDNNKISWPERFTSKEKVNQLRASVGDERTWHREYLLDFVTDNDHFYTHNTINYYEEIPLGWKPYFRYRVAALDLAISDKETADKTAMLIANVYRVNGAIKIYLLPHIFNKRIGFTETINLVEETYHDWNSEIFFYIENTGYQRALAETLQKSYNLPAQGVDVSGMSKRERLSMTLAWHKKNKIWFPRTGLEPAIDQIVGFGDEKHDDLVDAFSLLVNQVIRLTHENKFPQVAGMMPPGIKVNLKINRNGPRTNSFSRSSFMSGVRSAVPGAHWG